MMFLRSLKHVRSYSRFLFRIYSRLNRDVVDDDITSQHSDILAMCCEVISSFFVIFAVLDLRVAEVVLKRRFKLLSFFYNNLW